MQVPNITLNNNVEMPLLGLGVYKVHEREVQDAVKVALEAGYRSIDTAALYGNEKGVGEAVHESGLPRGDLFITTKVWNADQGYDSTLRAFEMSLHQLGMDYVDLYLIHWPVAAKYKATWRALERLYEQKVVRVIGVSNFQPHHLDDLLDGANVVPAVDQVELHPMLSQKELRRYSAEKRIAIEAWSPLMRGGEVLSHPVITDLAAIHGKTPAQIVLRWHVQQDIIVIPKSITPERIRQNIEIFDFELSDEEIATIDGLDNGERTGPDPDNFDF